MNLTLTPNQLQAITGWDRLSEYPATSVVLGLPDPDYRKIGAVSGSFIGEMDPTPGHACAFFEKKDATHFRIGRLVHQQVLTPNIPVQSIALIPERYTPSPKSKAKLDENGQAKWNANDSACELWTAQQVAAGRMCMDRKEYDITMGCIQSLAENPTSNALMADGDAEVTLVERMTVSGVEFLAKARIDWVPRRGSALVDIKTVIRGEGTLREFSKKVKWEKYGFKAAWYLDRWNRCNPDDQRSEFAWIVVEKGAPFAVSFYYLDAFSLEPYREQVRKKLEVFASCIRAGEFTADNNTIQLLAA